MELRALIEKIQAGDVCAFTELVRRFQDMAFGYAFVLLRDFQSAEDAAQEAFLAAYANLHTLREPDAFPGWLRGIVRHQCAHILRRRRVETVPLDQVTDAAAQAQEPQQLLEAREMRAAVLAAVNTLPQTLREVTALYYIREYSQQEIAAFLQVPVTTVNNRLHAARTKLKRRMLPMVKETLKQNSLPPDFAERVGKIVQIQGPVVEARFAPGERPSIFSALTLANPPRDMPALLEVAEHVGDDMARCVLLSETTGLKDGMKLVSTGQPASEPITAQTAGRVLDILSAPPPAPQLLETGIKALDLFCPFTQGGRVGLFAEWGLGTLVLLPEILRDLHGKQAGVTLFTFLPPHADAAQWQETTAEITNSSGDVRIVYLTVADPVDPAFVQQFDTLDATIYLSRRLPEQGIYPAVDPFLSASRLFATDALSAEHKETAQAVRDLLRRYYELQFSLEGPGRKMLTPEERTLVQRARKVQRFLSQPFFVAEPYTNRPGKYVPLAETLRGCKAILAGDADAIHADRFAWVGSYVEAVESAQQSR
jgi:RNA polymerase sigma factor (sigma-70 family)